MEGGDGKLSTRVSSDWVLREEIILSLSKSELGIRTGGMWRCKRGVYCEH